MEHFHLAEAEGRQDFNMERHFWECEKWQGIWTTADCCGADSRGSDQPR